MATIPGDEPRRVMVGELVRVGDRVLIEATVVELGGDMTKVRCGKSQVFWPETKDIVAILPST